MLKKVENIMNELIKTNNEQLLFSLSGEGMALSELFLELSYSQSLGSGFLYYFVTGRARDEGSFMKAFFTKNKVHTTYADYVEHFDYLPFIRRIEICDTDYENILSLLKRNPLPSVRGDAIGRDGHTLCFHNYVDCDAVYSYWLYPPKGYEHLKEIVNIISCYITEYHGKALFLETR